MLPSVFLQIITTYGREKKPIPKSEQSKVSKQASKQARPAGLAVVLAVCSYPAFKITQKAPFAAHTPTSLLIALPRMGWKSSYRASLKNNQDSHCLGFLCEFSV